MAAAVRKLRDDPELGQRLGARARELARRHLRDAQAERLVAGLEQLAAGDR
jgi:hypothetical protein